MKNSVWALLLGAMVLLASCSKENDVKPAAKRAVRQTADSGGEDNPPPPPHHP